MRRHDELPTQILGARADANVGLTRSAPSCATSRSRSAPRGSQHVFRRAGVDALINLQRDADKAKVYQMRQLRAVLVEYGLTGGEPPGPTEGV